METISLKRLVEDSIVPLAFFDTDLNLLSSSSSWSPTFDLTANQKSFTTILSKTTPELKHLVKKCLSGFPCNINEQEVTFEENIVKWFDWQMAPIKNEEDIIVGMAISANDVTARKKENDLMKMVKKVAKTGGFELNLTTNEYYWTSVTKEIFEVSNDYLPEREKAELLFKEGSSRDKLIAVRQKAIKKGTPFDVELQLITAMSNEKWVRMRGHTDFKDGVTTRIFGTVQDINARKLAEIKYHTEAERLKLATAASEVGSWDLTLPERTAIWDDMCFKLHNIDKATCVDIYKSWRDALPPEDFHRIVNEAYLNYTGEEKTIMEYQVFNPDGTLRDIRATVKFLKIENDYRVKAIGIVVDVTKEKEAERRLKESVELRNKQNEHLTNFAHMVSHDLRAHSTNLSMVANFLIDEQSTEEKLKLLQMLKDATDSLVNTVHNLNTIVQSTAEVPAQMVELNLLEAITRVKNNIAPQIAENKAQIVLEVSKKHEVKAVPAYLDSIFLNLLTNSIKYAMDGRKPLIRIGSKYIGKQLQVSFEDNGRGIDLEKHRQSIFGMHKTFHRNKDAMGVGLYLTKNQIESMNGKISVKSKVDVGTTFTLEFQTN